MKLVKDYVKKFGDYSFSSKKINSIDYAIFSLLPYIDFNGIITKGKKITLNEALTKFIFFGDRKEFIKSGVFQKDLYEFVFEIFEKNRYKDILLSDYVIKLSNNEQFGALTIHLPNHRKIISFEGTDNSLVGWEEDLALVNTSLSVSDKDAITYLSKAIKLFDNNVVVLGHSKGGRLAITSSMYQPALLQSKIKEIYSFDGPGLLDKELAKKEYQRIKNRINHYVPSYSVLGMALNHGIEDIVVKSNYIDIRSHFVLNWVVKGTDFEKDQLSNLSKKWHKSLDEWLKIYTVDERKAIFRQIFNTFRDLGYTSLTEILSVKSLVNILLKTKEYDDDTKTIIKDFFAFTIKKLIK